MKNSWKKNSWVDHWNSLQMKNQPIEEKKTTLERENLQNVHKILQFLEQKIYSIKSEMTRENAQFQDEFNEIRLKIRIDVKMGKKKEKNDISKIKFDQLTQNFTILEEKTHWIRTEIEGENAEFQGEFNEILLKTRIEVKMGEKKENKTRFQRQNLTNWLKISQF